MTPRHKGSGFLRFDGTYNALKTWVTAYPATQHHVTEKGTSLFPAFETFILWFQKLLNKEAVNRFA
jgi:hypothetical protein